MFAGTVPSYTLGQQVTIVTNRHAFKFGGIYNLFRGGRWNYAAPTLAFDTWTISSGEPAAGRHVVSLAGVQPGPPQTSAFSSRTTGE